MGQSLKILLAVLGVVVLLPVSLPLNHVPHVLVDEYNITSPSPPPLPTGAAVPTGHVETTKTVDRSDSGFSSRYKARVGPKEAYPLWEATPMKTTCHDAADKCLPEHVHCALAFNASRRSWNWDHALAHKCGYTPLDPSTLKEIMSGKRVLFIGDSLGRMLALTTWGMACNHANLLDCDLDVAEPEFSIPTSCFLCKNPTGCTNSTHRHVKVAELTDGTYNSRDTRKAKKGIPDLRVMNIGDGVVHQIFANSVRRISMTLQRLIQGNGSLHDGPYDVIVMNTGRHHGPKDVKAQWWRGVAALMAQLTPFVKFVYLETGWPRPYYRTLNQDILMKYKFRIDRALANAGAKVIDLDGRITQRVHSVTVAKPSHPVTCYYSDPTHPDLKCFYLMVTVLMNHLKILFAKNVTTPSEGVRSLFPFSV